MSQQNSNKKTKGIIATLIACCILIAATIAIIYYRQQIIDQIAYWEYTPTSLIASFVDRTAMNSEGKFLFYSAKPQLLGQTQFNKACPTSDSNMAILGCYNGQDIYIYNVTNTQLDGIRDVTAAYEMLHAAYKRLSPTDLTKVDSLIEAEYKKQGDAAMKQLVAYFAVSEPGQRDNELFSMVATQLTHISPQLETYYSRYFSNRQVVVSLYNKYIGVFKSLKSRADSLSKQITALSASISSRSNQYNTDAQTLNNDIASFNNLANNNGFSSQQQFYNARTVLIERAAALVATKNSIQADITEYDSLVSEYNSIATQSQKLYNTINSRLVSTPSV